MIGRSGRCVARVFFIYFCLLIIFRSITCPHVSIASHRRPAATTTESHHVATETAARRHNCCISAATTMEGSCTARGSSNSSMSAHRRQQRRGVVVPQQRQQRRQHCYTPAATWSECCHVARAGRDGSISVRQLVSKRQVTAPWATKCFVASDRQTRRRLMR